MSVQTLNISLPKELVKRIDTVAKSQYKNRSELIREAVRLYLFDAERWENIVKPIRDAAKKAGYTSEEEINDMMYELRHGKKPSSS